MENVAKNCTNLNLVLGVNLHAHQKVYQNDTEWGKFPSIRFILGKSICTQPVGIISGLNKSALKAELKNSIKSISKLFLSRDGTVVLTALYPPGA
ncbi:unnamed protein product [Didymodactylos carnosus]|uniref:Uncharacterized protein n=1 Tax=Didymodactylos carnosus TaxID=1234261 RepID=A0A8S2DAJ4_9BILA|nr:unnamed protein product [Didymodactylos carnosus]CAF3699063.1 unnamed protein product [Didymodactylos carnosus]